MYADTRGESSYRMFDLNETPVIEPEEEFADMPDNTSSEASESEDGDDNGIENIQQQTDQILREHTVANRDWVDLVAADNIYNPFVADVREWNAEVDYVGHARTGTDFIIPVTLTEGMIFRSKWQLQVAVSGWSIMNNVQFVKERSNKGRWYVQCVEHRNVERPCRWALYSAASKKLNNLWKISRIEGVHCCANAMILQNHRQCTAKFIARIITPGVRAQIDLKPREIIGRINTQFNINISYSKAWDARRKAIKSIFGGWADSYRILLRYLETMRLHNDGSVYDVLRSADNRFERLFWAFGPCITGWDYCRPVLSLDGTFLLGRYRGTLLIAVGIDANNGLFPLAFAVVESECNDSWEWFLIKLREHIPSVSTREDLCILSDKHSGIIRGVREQLPGARHRHCLRHLRENFKKALRGFGIQGVDFLCNKMYWAGNTDDQTMFLQNMSEINEIDSRAYDWLVARDFEQWTLVHDNGSRYGSMTTNASESFNGVLKRARGLPIQALVSATYYHCIGIFLKRQSDVQRWDQEAVSELVPRAEDMIQKRRESARNIYMPTRISRNEFECSDYNGYKYTVAYDSESNATCSCGKSLIYHIPCEHIIACASSVRLTFHHMISHYYRIETYKETYSADFHVIPDITRWVPIDPSEGIIELLPPNLIRRGGRPRVQRIRNTMDEARENTTRKCGICKQHGHNRSTCPQNPENQRFN